MIFCPAWSCIPLGAMFMVVLMPIAAFSACYEEWSTPLPLGEPFGTMIGITMNMLFFYGGMQRPV